MKLKFNSYFSSFNKNFIIILSKRDNSTYNIDDEIYSDEISFLEKVYFCYNFHTWSNILGISELIMSKLVQSRIDLSFIRKIKYSIHCCINSYTIHIFTSKHWCNKN